MQMAAWLRVTEKNFHGNRIAPPRALNGHSMANA
jgi:hypothetical protein